MAEYNRIDIDCYGQYDEIVASTAVTPGQFVAADGGFPTAAKAVSFVALADRLQGKTIDDAYANEDPMQVRALRKGDLVWAWLVDEQNVALDAELELNAAGKLVAQSAGVAVATAAEAKDLTGAAGDERILVRIL